MGRKEKREGDLKLFESMASSDPEVSAIPAFPWFGYEAINPPLVA